MAFLAIATGAIKIGQKIFQGIKNRKEKKVEKKAAALVEAQNKQAQVEGTIGKLFSSMGGNDTQVISGSGNFLAGIKSAFSPTANFQPVSGAVAVNQQNKEAARVSGGMGGMNPMYLLLGAGVLLLLIFKKR